MSGMAVCRRILDGYPQTRIILSSGYPLKNQADLCLAEHEVCFLQKPFRSEELLSNVQDLLDLWAAAAPLGKQPDYLAPEGKSGRLFQPPPNHVREEFRQ